MTGVERVARMKGSRNARTGIRIHNARTKGRRLRLTRKQVVVTVLMLCLFMGSSIGYVWCNFEGTRLGYDLSELKNEEMRLQEINRKLKVELATLLSPEKLEKVAVKELGMVHPTPEQIATLR
jgi:cell division protein FtsL